MVLDPFIGSGTTGIPAGTTRRVRGLVALQMQRRFVGIELNPAYLKIAEDRLNGEIIRG